MIAITTETIMNSAWIAIMIAIGGTMIVTGGIMTATGAGTITEHLPMHPDMPTVVDTFHPTVKG